MFKISFLVESCYMSKSCEKYYVSKPTSLNYVLSVWGCPLVRNVGPLKWVKFQISFLSTHVEYIRYPCVNLSVFRPTR